MKEIYINADDYNSDSIKTIQGNNNAEEYKIYLQYDNEKIDLTGKTVNLGFLRVGSTEGDIIENLNVTNPKEGEITLKITNKISKRNGTYSCQLAILGEGDFLEHTATFTLTVENNIFSDITKAIVDSKDFTYLENILDKASKLNEKLKENTSTATNANSNLESNITEANNINSKLLENTSTATSLNKNLESNIDLAKEVKETIKDLDTKNIEATEKIETLTGLNSKAEELSNNINKGLPLNSELIKNTESAKAANTNLLAANQEATSKNTELQASLEKIKKYISGLDGSQNIPQLRLDVIELQNGLKSNQALAYTGNSISVNNTLEGRTEGMVVKGRTLQNLIKNESYDLKSLPITLENNYFTFTTDGNFRFRNIISNEKNLVPSTEYTIIYEVKENTLSEGNYVEVCNTTNFNSSVVIDNVTEPGIYSKRVLTKSQLDESSHALYFNSSMNNASGQILKLRVMLVKGNLTDIPKFFEGIKSFGEAEQEGDKYKISILSSGKNLLNFKSFENYIKNTHENEVLYSIKLKPNTNYTFSDKTGEWNGKGAFLILKDKDKKEVSRLIDSNVGNRKSISFTTNNNTNYYLFTYKNNIGKFNSISSNYQIEEGSQATFYEPYQSYKKDILIKEPLRSKDDKCDILYEDNGQVKIDRYVGIRKYQEGDEKNKDVITDKINTVYILDKPVTEIVENCVDIDLDTFGEKTYFNILNSLPGILDFKVPSNIGSVVQNMAKEVNNIWDVINNLLVPSIVKANGNLAMIKLNNNLK